MRWQLLAMLLHGFTQANGSYESETACIAANKHDTRDLADAMRQAWWSCSKAIIESLASTSAVVALESVFQAESSSITKQLNSLKASLESSKPQQIISPAFQWAQSPEEVFLSVKFAHKLDTPATMGVTIQSVEFEPNRMTLKGSSPGRKQFLLDVQLYDTIEPERSSWKLASVGRCSIQLAKAGEPSRWPALIAEGSKKPQNMHFWFDKHEQHADELDKLDSDDDEESAPAASTESKDNATESESDATAEDSSSAGGGSTPQEAVLPEAIEQQQKAETPLTDEEKAAQARQKRIDAAKAAVQLKKKEAQEALDAEFKSRRAALDKQFAEEQSAQVQAARAEPGTAADASSASAKDDL